MLNDYEDKKTSDDDEFTGNEDPSWKKQKTTGSRRSSTTSKTPLLDPGPEDGETKEGETRPGDTLEEPDAKRPRTESDKDDLLLDLNTAIQEIDCGYVMEFDLNFTSNRQRKMFMRNPQAYLVKKVSGAEVCYRKLNAEDRKLFDNAKASEVSAQKLFDAVSPSPSRTRPRILNGSSKPDGFWSGSPYLKNHDKKHLKQPRRRTLLTLLMALAKQRRESWFLASCTPTSWTLRSTPRHLCKASSCATSHCAWWLNEAGSLKVSICKQHSSRRARLKKPVRFGPMVSQSSNRLLVLKNMKFFESSRTSTATPQHLEDSGKMLTAPSQSLVERGFWATHHFGSGLSESQSSK